jgi:hypothetical protein
VEQFISVILGCSYDFCVFNKSIKVIRNPLIISDATHIRHNILSCRPLLGNGREATPVARARVTQAVSGQQQGKHVPAATDRSVTIEEQCFLCGSGLEVITREVEEMSSVKFCKEG